MKSRIFLVVIFLFLVTACTATPAAPTLPPTPAPTPSPTFAASKFGASDIDVTYCTMDGQPQKMDLYYPKSGGPWSVMIYVHGGSWTALDKAEGVGWRYLNDSGFLVVSVNYRLATTQVKFPVMIEDIKCAVRYLRAHSAEYHLNPDRIGALGASAGGHLVALLGTADKSAGWDVGEYLDQSSRVQAVVTESGLSDFTVPINAGVSMAVYFAFGALAGDPDPRMATASPVTYITSDDPPFLIIHGDEDGTVPVEQAKILNEKLTKAGVSSTLVIVQGAGHDLKGINGQPTVPTSAEISADILKFLQTNLE
ncbi:MAG: alpha/beta hydrolase [Anaerolineales bacterium]